MTYYEIINADDSVLRSKDMPDGFDPADVAHKFGPTFRSRIIPQVELPDPTVDEATQRLGRVVETVEATRVTLQRELLTKTSEQLAAEADQTADDAERDLLKAAYVLFKNGNATNAQAQRAIAWLIKQQAGV